mgnify:CR=1 FL=1
MRGYGRDRSTIILASRLHPDVAVSDPSADGSIPIELPDETIWRFRASGAKMTIEEAVYFADSTGPMRSWQIVLRGVTFGGSEITWSLNRD